MAVPPLPDGSILLHVGPHKTGTTAVQTAAFARKARLAEAGVAYPGVRSQHSRGAMAVGERSWGWADRGGAGVGIDEWHALVTETSAAPDKVFLSSEFFGELDPAQIARVADDLGRHRLHVVVTLRPLSKILPSSWQQYVKGGMSRRFETWLGNVLSDPPDPKVTPTFWTRQDHGALVERWAAVVGADAMTVIVVDESDHTKMPTTFEQLLGLTAGSLAPAPGARTNRSMTAAECELFRRANRLATGDDVGWDNFERIIRNAAIVRVVESRVPEPTEPRIHVPHWAKVRAAELGAEAAAVIAASGVRVVGNLDHLAPDPGPAPASASTQTTNGVDEPEVPTELPIAAAVDALVGALSGALGGGPFLNGELLRKRRDSAPPAPAADADERFIGDLPVREATTPELVEVLRARVSRGLRRRLARR